MTWNHSACQFTDALASSDPTPGGGAAAAMTGAMGCALILMAASTTLKRKNTPSEYHPFLEKSLQELGTLHEQLKNLITQDAEAYETYLVATKLPKEAPTRTQSVQEALWQATAVPAQTAQTCQAVLAQLKIVQPYISDIIISDVHCAQHLLAGALACCVENIRANATYITDASRQEQLKGWINIFSQGALL